MDPAAHPESESVGDREFTRRQVLEGALAGGAAIAAAGALSGEAFGAGTQRRGGTLRIGHPIESQPVIDGLAARTAGEILRSFMLNDRPINVSPVFRLEYPVAEFIRPNKTATEWTIRLKQGVEFHNGKTLSADDLIFTILRMNNPRNFANSFSILQPPLPKLYRVRKLDNRTVRIRLTGPNAVLDWLLSDGGNFPVLPVGFDPKNPVGCGPFRLVSFVPFDRAIFRRFANYHGPKAFVDEVQSIVIADPTARINALYSGQIDIVQQPTPTDAGGAAANGFSLLRARSSFITNVQMKCDVPPFNDNRVRLALKLAIDRQQIRNNGFNGFGLIGNDVWGRGDPFFNQTLKRTRDVERARSLLRQAGKAGVTVEMVIRTRDLPYAQVIQQNAAEAGFRINIRVVPGAAYYAPATFQTAPLLIDKVQGFDFLSYYVNFLAPGAFFNRMKWTDQEFETLRAQAIRTIDDAARKRIVQRMMRIVFDRGPWLIPVHDDMLTPHSPRVAGFAKADAVGYGQGANQIHKLYVTS